MTGTYKDLPKTGLREHLMFLALLMPTFVVIAAAAVSLMDVDHAGPAVETLAVCGPCGSYDGEEGP